jgi:hypothetical protein
MAGQRELDPQIAIGGFARREKRRPHHQARTAAGPGPSQRAHEELSRRFPPPWSIEDIGAAFVVKDANGQKLAYV